jgi:hypothetical protein
VCAQWDYLKTNTGDGEVTCKVPGAAPNRVLWCNTPTCSGIARLSLNLVNFQIRLYEAPTTSRFNTARSARRRAARQRHIA